MSKTTLQQKFDLKVEKGTNENDCWLWVGSRTGNNYGNMLITLAPGERTQKYAHQVSFFLYHGRWPHPNRIVRHTCDTTLCVNPLHLVEGTYRENTEDRRARGSLDTKPKLTEDEVRYIRTSHLSQITLALELGVSQATISNVQARRVYKYVTD